MCQGACCCSFTHYRLPISDKWMLVANQNINYPRCETKHWWRSVDAHSQNGAETVLLSLLYIEAADTLVVHKRYQITITTLLTNRQIVDAPLTIILRLGQWLCCCLFSLLKLPIHRLCIRATKSLLNYRTYRSTNRWHFIDTHSQNGAVTVLLAVLPIQAANTSVMHKSDQITV